MLQCFQKVEGLDEDGEFRQRFRERAQQFVARVERGADHCRIGFAIDGGHELPEIQRVSQVFVRAWWQLGMQRDDGGCVPREMLRDRVFPLEPSGALAWAIEIRHNPGDQRFREPEHQRAAVLQDLTTVRCESVGDGRFGGGADGKVQFCHVNPGLLLKGFGGIVDWGNRWRAVWRWLPVSRTFIAFSAFTWGHEGGTGAKNGKSPTVFALMAGFGDC